DKFPIGAFMQKGLTMKTGQTHVPRYLDRLLKHVQDGDIDPSFVITHKLPLDEAPAAYDTFRKKEQGCIKVVLKPWNRTGSYPLVPSGTCPYLVFPLDFSGSRSLLTTAYVARTIFL